MALASEVRERCSQLYDERKEELKLVLCKFFEEEFISKHRVWRATPFNKKYTPVPVSKYFSSFPEEKVKKYSWPNMSEEVVRKLLRELGFFVSESEIFLCVPPIEKAKKLTFAQEYVKKVNHAYSVYCAEQKKKAKEVYSDLLSSLKEHSDKNVIIYDDYTFFKNVKINFKEIEKKGYKMVKKFMKQDGIEECFENGEYCIKVYHDNPE